MKANHWIAYWLAKSATLAWVRSAPPGFGPNPGARSVGKVPGSANADLEEISMRTQLNGTAS